MLEANILQLETGGVTSLDSAFNFTAGSFTQRLSSVVKTWSAERLIEVSPNVKDEGESLTATGRHTRLRRTLKAAEQKEENIIREVILPYLDRQIATAEKKVSIQRGVNHHVEPPVPQSYNNAFPTYNTGANAWAPQADINWFAGSSHDSKFVRFSKRCTTEEEAVTWVLRRSEVWVDNRLRRLNRAILPERGRAIDMIEAVKSHLCKVTPKQPVRARSSGRRMLQRRIGTQP